MDMNNTQNPTEAYSLWTTISNAVSDAAIWIKTQLVDAKDFLLGKSEVAIEKISKARKWVADLSVDESRSAVIRLAANCVNGWILLIEAVPDALSHIAAFTIALLYSVFYKIPKKLWERMAPAPAASPV